MTEDALLPRTDLANDEESDSTSRQTAPIATTSVVEDFSPTLDKIAGSFDPFSASGPQDPLQPVQKGFDIAPLSRMSDLDPEKLMALGRGDAFEPLNRKVDKSLEAIGVKWADHPDEKNPPKVFDKQVGFYEMDYDPTGEEGKKITGLDGVQAANVFGRQFSRAELEKDSEGRKIIEMMEGQRTGKYQDQGFLEGVTDFDRSNLPWVGVAMDVGTGIADAIDISNSMKKMQRGEAVTDHEALGVRRFMLQQEIESGRTFGYNVGSVIRQAPTFMMEMALAGKMVAASTAVGAAIGTATGVPLLGTIVGGVGGALFGGGLLVSRGLRKLGGAMAGKAASKAATDLMGDIAAREVGKAITTAEGLAVRRAVGKEFFTKEVKDAVRKDVVARLGEGAAEEVIRRETNAEMYRRAAASATKVVLNGKDLDVAMATRVAVQGDTKNLISSQFNHGLEELALKASGESKEAIAAAGYWKRKAFVRKGLQNLDPEIISNFRKGFLTGSLESVEDGYARTALANGVLNMGGGGADRLVAGSMSQVTGKVLSAENSFTRAVADKILDNQLKSFTLKYGGKGFVNGLERVGRFAADHALNGLLRWENSAFGGSIGTIARSGSVLGGKMAALKEAIGVAMVEAPVRGAMQVGAQAPLWPVYAGLSGRNPLDFTIRGQLGNEATALRTGDESLMSNARAIAFGSLLVEYASENAGRGIESFASGVMKPVWNKTFLAAPTAKVGSYMSQKLNAMFGFEKLMAPEHLDKVTGYVFKTLNKDLVDRGESEIASRVIKSEIKKIMQTRTLDGASDALRDAVTKAGYKDVNSLLRESVKRELNLTKWRVASQYMFADYMLRKGLTPQKFNSMLERVGYDGVIAEMAEERYGGFVQGILGLNDRPSDEGFKGRWSAAMEGLFPDKEQLLTEAIAFAVPSVVSSGIGHMYSVARMGGGGMAKAQSHLAQLRSVNTSRGTVSIPGVTAEYARQLREWKDRVDNTKTAQLGDSESNRATVRSNITANMGSVDNGRIAPMKDATDAGQIEMFQNELIDDLLKSGTHAQLREQIEAAGGEALFGADGVIAIENEWRRIDGHRFDAADSREAAISGPESDFARAVKDAPLYSGDADISDIVSEITVQLGGTEDSGAMGGSERRGNDTGATVNLYSESLLDETAESLAYIGKLSHRMTENSKNDLSLGRRISMHLLGVLDGLTTGNWALAKANPVQYMSEDYNLPRDLMGRLRNEYKGSMAVAKLQLEQNGEQITTARMEEIADTIFEKRMRDYAASYLAATNVLAVSRSDISEAALRLVAYRNRAASGQVVDFHSDSFKELHKQDIIEAQKEIVAQLAQSAVNGIIAMNDHSGMGHRKSMALNLSRAMQFGTNAEVMAAIGDLPVFRYMHRVFDISGLSQEYDDAVNSGFFGRSVDVEVISHIDANKRVLSEDELSTVIDMMGRDATLYTEGENQTAAKQFVRQVKAVSDSGLNTRFSDRLAPEGSVGREVSVVKDNATGMFTLTYEAAAGGRVVTEQVATMQEAVSRLDAAGFDAHHKRIVLTTSRSITFSDALSGALFLNQDNLVAARSELLRHMGVREDLVDESILPPMLRKDPATGRLGFRDASGNFVSTETDDGRRAAADATRALVAAADRADATGTEEDLKAKAIVYGGMVNGQRLTGFEKAAEKLVASRGAVRATEDDAASVLGNTSGWSFRAGSLPCGDTLVIMRDYDNQVDSEALLRTALANGMRSGFSRTPAADRVARNTILAQMAREFRKAADRVIEGLDAEHDADKIDAIRAAVSEVLGEEGSTVNCDGLAAIASACGFFSNERGLGDEGNGFLHQAELAVIADYAREAEVYPYFMSVVDQLLGGSGFFTSEPASFGGVARLRDAFAPPGARVLQSRQSSVFGGAYGRVTRRDPGLARLRWSKEGMLGGFNVPHEIVRTPFVSVEGYLSSVAGACHDMARGFEQAHGRPPASTEEVYRLLHADMFGGTSGAARPSISGAVLGGDESAPVESGLQSAITKAVATTATTTRVPTANEISQKTAVSLAKNFRFLVPGGATATDVRNAKARLERFLVGRGMSETDRSKVLAAFSVVGARKARFGERAEEALQKALSDPATEQQVREAGGNSDIFLEDERRDAVVKNDDLMDCGEQFRYVFPIESTNCTSVLHRLREELRFFSSRIPAGTQDAPLAVLSDALNVFGAVRKGTSAERLAEVYQFDDDEITDHILDESIAELERLNRLDLAFALSALRNIPRNESRRGKALRQVSQMSPVSGFYAQQGEDGLFAVKRQGSSGSRASIDAIRSIVLQPFMGALGANANVKDVSTLGKRISAMVNFIRGDKKSFEKYEGDYKWFNGATIEEVVGILGEAGKAANAESVQLLKDIMDVNVKMTPELHDRIVAYAEELRLRMAGTADAIERMFGANEICYVLRNPFFTEHRIRNIENLVASDNKDARESVFSALSDELEMFQPHAVKGESPSISRFINTTFAWPAQTAANLMFGKGAASVNSIRSREDSDRFLRLLGGEVARLATRGVLKSGISGSIRTNVFGSDLDGSVQSPLSRLVDTYAVSMPRSTEVLSGKGASGFRDRERTTMIPSSPMPAALAIEDKVLMVLGLRDDYLARGGRFADGSSLTHVALGAKNRWGEVVEPRFTSRIVNRANMDAYILGNDFSNLRFQLYHGEKPTSYSIQLPGYVAQALFEQLAAGNEEVMPSHIPDGIDMKALKQVKDVRAVEDPVVRESVYRLLYAAVATAARCDQISPKRVQILMSQGTMSVSYRDSHFELSDTDGVKALKRVDDTGDGYVPGQYVNISLGGSATSWMGFWLDHGYLIDTLRKISTNPKATSFKTHFFSLFNAEFMKGQGHDFGLGIQTVDEALELHESRGDTTANESILKGLEDMRHYVASVLGYRGDDLAILDPVDEEEWKSWTKGEKEKKRQAILRADRFFRCSSMRSTDMEANKAGPFDSACGLYSTDGIVSLSHPKYGTFFFDVNTRKYSNAVEDVMGKDADGKDVVIGRALSKPLDIPRFSMEPEFKNNAVPLAWAAAAYMKVATKETMDALGVKTVKHLSKSEVGELVSTWKKSSDRSDEAVTRGETTLKDTGIFNDYGSATGDSLEFVDDGDSASMRFFTRNAVSQIVANSDAPADVSTEHPYATNAVRDTYLNEMRRIDANPDVRAIPDTVAAAGVNRLLNFANLLVNRETLVDARVMRDEELAANLRMCPFDLRELNREFRKKNSVFARSMRLPVNSNHGILLPSGGHVVKANAFDHTAEVEWAPGTSQYTKDMFRSARIFNEAEKAAYGLGRSYGSGAVNVRDDGSFRYGWSLDSVKFAEFLEEPGVVQALGIDRTMFNVEADGLLQIMGASDALDTWLLSKCISAFRELNSRGASFQIETTYSPSARATKTRKNVYVLPAATNLYQKFLGCFTDYTGRALNDEKHMDLSNISFEDLFLSDGSFDYAAVDRRMAKTVDGGQEERLFLGGSFFSGNRRPSGNVEAANGFCRATMPVRFSAVSGRPAASAMYILDPVLNYVQGSDTDGDSATVITMKGRPSAEDLDAVRALAKLAVSVFNEKGAVATGDFSSYRTRAKQFLDEAKTRYPQFFTTEGELSDRFSDAIANLIFSTEIENYRKSPNVHQGWRQNDVPGVKPDAVAYDLSLLAETRDVPDVGAVGRHPVGPNIVSGDRPVGQALAKKFKVSPTASMKKAFVSTVNKMNPEVNGDLLNPDSAAALSDAAADASEARGRGVKMQASIGHLGAIAMNDRRLQEVVPGLFKRRSGGYRPLEDFIGHIDSVSNALFDVVKDMFSPRAGWQKEMLNHFVGRLVQKANEDYAKDKTVQFDDAWFFDAAVSYLKDAMDPKTYTGALMTLTQDWTGRCDSVSGTLFDVNTEDTLADALFDVTGTERKAFDYASDDYLSWLHETVSGLTEDLRTDEGFGRFQELLAEAYGDDVAMSKAMDHLQELVTDADGATGGTQRDVMLAVALMTPIKSLGKKSSGLESAFKVFGQYSVQRTIGVLENSASPDTAFRGDEGGLASYNKALERDRRTEDKDAPFSETNRAKVLLNAAAGTNMRRIEDDMVDSQFEARDMHEDIPMFDTMLESGSDTPERDWAEAMHIDVTNMMSADWQMFTEAKALADASRGKFPANVATVVSNRERLHHVIGAVAEMSDGARESAEALLENGTAYFRTFVAKGFDSLVRNALEKGMYGDDVRTLLEYMYVDAESGDIEFIAKPSSADAVAVRRGFEAVIGSSETVNVDGNDIPLSEMAEMLTLHVALSESFSAAVDPRIRPNLSVFFGTDRVNRMERWGTGIYEYPATRMLCNFRQQKGTGYFDLGFKTDAGSAFDLVCRLSDSAKCNYGKFCSRKEVPNVTSLQARTIAENGVLRSDNGFRVEGVKFRLTDAIPYHVGNRGGRARNLVNRQEFDTLEDAYNDLLDQVLAAHFGTDGVITGGMVQQAVLDGVKPNGLIEYTSLDELETLKRILVSALRGPYAKELSDAVMAIDPRALDFSKAAERVPGITRVNAPAILALREYLESRATQNAGNTRPSLEIGSGTVVRAQRMRRGDFDMSGKEVRPRHSIERALESAFGKWTENGGVRVTRVKRDGKPVNLLKVERRFKTKSGVKVVTTYVSYGDYMPLDFATKEYKESLLASVRKMGYKGDMKDLERLSNEELQLLAQSAGLHVDGESRTGLDTNGLLLLTGVIRLDEGAGFRTLFHEYFHQMSDFFSKTGVMTAEDKADLAQAFGMDPRTGYDEETAADAFASFVTGLQDAAKDSRVSSFGKAVDKVFTKVYRNCKAYLDGAKALDVNGAPVFMQILVSGNLSDRSDAGLARRAEQDYREIEDALLNEETEFHSGKSAYKSDEAHFRMMDVATALRTDGSADAVEAALKELARVAPPQFTAVANTNAAMETPPVTVEPRVTRKRGKTRARQSTEVGRMQEFFTTAIERFNAGDISIGADGEADIRRIKSLRQWGDLPASDVGQMVAVARRVVLDTAGFLGIQVWKDGKLTPEGKAVVSDEAVAEMAWRLCNAMNADVAARNKANPYGRTARHASAEQVYGRMLAEVAPDRWVSFARERIEEASDRFATAAEKLRAKADAVGASDPQRATDMRNDAANLEGLARKIKAAFVSMLNGQPLHEVQGFPDTRAETFQYGNLLDGVRHELLQNGMKRYSGGKYSDNAVACPEFQEAFNLAANTLFTVACARSYLKETGQDFPPVGAQPTVDSNATAPAPGYLIDEADTSAQMIIQSPGLWMANDMMKDFMGVQMREIMTDHDIKAKTESANSTSLAADFIFGADCHAGEKVREVSYGESNVKFGEDGVDVYDEKYRHTIMKYAAVRGYALGLFNRDARRTGRELTLRDTDTVNFVLQFVKVMSCGDDRMLTGIDIPWPNRATLNEITKNYGTVDKLLSGPLSFESVRSRVKRYRGEVATSGVPFTDGAMPCNIDHLFHRIYEAIPEDFRNGGLLETLAQTIIDVAAARGRDTGTEASGDARDRLARALYETGYAEMSADGRCVLALPTSYAKSVWESSDAYRNLLASGRTAGLLNLDYWAARFASEANGLHAVAAKSRFMKGGMGRSLTSAGACGMWFHHGSGAHALNVERYENAKETFGDAPSADERLAVAHTELMEVLARHTAADDQGNPPAGNRPAFALITDSSGNVRVAGGASHRQVQFLIRLLSRYGVLVRNGEGRLVPLQKNFSPVDFTKAVLSGEFSFGGRRGLPVYLDADTTLEDFDRAIYTLVTQAITDETTGVRTGIDEIGSRQGLIDASELAGRLERALSSTNPGKVVAISPQQMFKMTSRLGSSMTASQNLRAMCDEIVTAERFKGCMTQMLQTVGPDGAMNYVVRPTDESAAFLPDEYWGALARFTIARCQNVPGMIGYDAGKTGVQNMQAVYDAFADKSVQDFLAGKARGQFDLTKPEDRKAKEKFVAVTYDESVDLKSFGADTLFGKMLVRNDGVTDDPNVAARAVHGEASGYMKQLLGTAHMPSVGKVMKGIDRAMSYSKAASVGLSAFFAFATRFESPVAAAGFWATVMGYKKRSADAARAIGEKLGRAGQTGAFNSDTVFLADILNAITSNDPYIREMRELCDLIGMPLTDSIQNPINDRQGAIDHDIDTMCRWLEREGRIDMSKRLRSGLRAALHNPSEYAFSNVLNGVKMAVVSQTLRRLREECRDQKRPFDPVRELRKYSAYINAEIGGIDPGRYAFLTPQMQNVLRRTMFSYQWTMGSWVAGSGEIFSDMLFGGHHTTPELRRLAFIRWLRMIGIVKVGVPVFMQAAIKAIASAIAWARGDDPDDDNDPYGIDAMPWLCFNNEEKIGALSFDITPILKLCGSSETLQDVKLGRGAWPYVTAVAGGAIGGLITRGPVGAALGAYLGYTTVGSMVPAYVGRGKNTTGRRRYYMHFGKQNDEFWRWFNDSWTQATGKLSIPTQKVVEGLFGSTNGSNFAKGFAKKSMFDRWFNLQLDPNENAFVNWLTAFMPFSAVSVAGHPDAGIIGVMGPVQMGASKTYVQKKLVDRLVKFAEDDRHSNPWAHPSNKKDLALLCKGILDGADANGVDPKDILSSAIGQAASHEYRRLFDAMPKDIRDNAFNVPELTKALRALTRLGRKQDAILQAMSKRYKAAGVDWEKQPNHYMAELVREAVEGVRSDPYGWGDREARTILDKYARPNDKAIRQAANGGDALANFLATDEVPETLFGVPVISKDYTDEDLAFFEDYPEAGGYYDLEDGGTEPLPPKGPRPRPGTTGADKGGESVKFYGQRNDGTTWKGSGWLGELGLKGGGVATEYTSQSDAVVGKDGKRIDFPTLVPTLSKDEIATMVNDIIPNGKPAPASVMQKAVDHALKMQKECRSVFANDGLSIYDKAVADAIPFVKEHEGFRANAYRKKLGVDKKTGKTIWDKWTIGYGQTELNGRPVRAGDIIDEPTASKFVESRIRTQAADLYRDMPWSRNFKNPGTLSAMYDIMYNAGPSIFNEKNSPKLNKAMKTFKGDYDKYMWQQQIPTYRNKGNGVPLKGLKNRNNDMTRLFGPTPDMV